MSRPHPPHLKSPDARLKPIPATAELRCTGLYKYVPGYQPKQTEKVEVTF